ncbi:hypothetical protein MMC13_005207 [Lambiella insularis]|nr:hypothetical protein [Lambiella insularis]
MDMSMPSLGNSSTTLMPMSSMAMTFFASDSTPLYSLSWTPASTGAYAGTCIFLIVLASLFRGLLAAKAALEQRWLDAALRRHYVSVVGRPSLKQRLAAEGDKQQLVLSANGVEEEVLVLERKQTSHEGKPWRVSEDGPRAVADTVIVGVGYLL